MTEMIEPEDFNESSMESSSASSWRAPTEAPMEVPREQTKESTKTEIIAFCSGKGGTGKSLMCSCFGYALLRAGKRVLMIDGDPATDGLSLFLLGPKGMEQIDSFGEENTFIGVLDRFQKTGSASFEPRAIHRRGEDHGVTYTAIISGKGLYGDQALTMVTAVPDLNQGVFRAGIRHLFNELRVSGEYDYVLVDTRGGFAFESTDLCALADSFIVITDPDYTSFYQDRNLVSRIAAATREVESASLLRAIIVNKSVDVTPMPGKPYLETLEVLFRDLLVKEFPIRFQDTHPIPVSIEALLAYKSQKIPYRSAPDSLFSMATLAAFSDILQLVTSRWTVQEIDRWNVLVDEVTHAVKQKQELEAKKEEERSAREKEFEVMRVQAAANAARAEALERENAERLETVRREYDQRVLSLERELKQQNLLYEREYARSEALISTSIAPPPIASAPQSSIESAVISDYATAPRPTASRKVELSRSRWPLVLGLVVAIVVVGLLSGVYMLSRGSAAKPSTNSGGGDFSGPSAAELNAPANTRPSWGDYAVLLTGESTNKADYRAPAGAVRAAQNAGYKTFSLYQKDDAYTAAALFRTQAEANDAAGALSARHDARLAGQLAVVTLSDWCPVKMAADVVVIDQLSVPSWNCITLNANPAPSTSLAPSKRSSRSVYIPTPQPTTRGLNAVPHY